MHSEFDAEQNLNAQPDSIGNTINQEQLYAADTVIEVVCAAPLLRNVGLTVNWERLFSIGGRAGTGKIYLDNYIISILREDNSNASTLAWTGITAVLQCRGRIMYLTFQVHFY